jgi:uncharacterized protein YbjT (DUF2867 family)
MKVFVAGGTGAIGGHAVPALVRSGHQVTVLARTPEKAALLSKLGVSPVIASIFDRAALKNMFAAHHAVVNLATAIPPTTKFMQTKAWADNNRVVSAGSTGRAPGIAKSSLLSRVAASA